MIVPWVLVSFMYRRQKPISILPSSSVMLTWPQRLTRRYQGSTVVAACDWPAADAAAAAALKTTNSRLVVFIYPL